MSLAALCRPTPRTRVSADNNLTPEYTFMDTNCIFMHIYVSVRTCVYVCVYVCVCVCVCVCIQQQAALWRGSPSRGSGRNHESCVTLDGS